MKKLVVVTAVVAFSLGSAAQDNKMQNNKMQDNKMQDSKMDNAKMDKDHVGMHDGKMMVMKDGKKMPMDKDMTMGNGTMVTTTGMVKMKDGKTMQMKDGDRMDMNGMMMEKKTMPKK